jgi:hypothetical protein
MTMALTDECPNPHDGYCENCGWTAEAEIARLREALAEQQAPECDGNRRQPIDYGFGETKRLCPGCPKCRPESIAEPAQAEVEAACAQLARDIHNDSRRSTTHCTVRNDNLRVAIAAARRCAQAESERAEAEECERRLSVANATLRTERDTLRERVAELERENSRLMERLTVCIKANNRARGK